MIAPFGAMLAGSLLISALAVTASTALAQQGALQCIGTEPFWTVTHTGQAMWYSSPVVQRLELAPVRARNADGRQPDYVRVYQTRRLDGGGAATLIVTRHEQPCSDEMSDRRYPYAAIYIEGERVLSGCCRWTQ